MEVGPADRTGILPYTQRFPDRKTAPRRDPLNRSASRDQKNRSPSEYKLALRVPPLQPDCFSQTAGAETTTFFRGNAMIPRFFGPGVRAALFGMFVLAATPVVLAQETQHPAPNAATGDEKAFLAENDTAMTRMMNDMAAKPSGDIDRDFVAMMAVIELRYGKNEQLRRIAQEIIVDQMQEIAAMKLAIGEPVPASAPAPTQVAPEASGHDRMNMSHDMQKQELK
jgi:hypothetical protein